MKATEVLQQILDALSAEQIAHAVIHHADALHTQVDSDIDLVLGEHPRQRLETIIRRLEATGNIRLINRLHYEVPHGYYYILSITDHTPEYLHLDVTYDPYGTHHYLYTSQDLLDGRHRNDARVWSVRPEKEATYLLIKKAYKGKIDSETHQRIARIAAHNSESFRQEWKKWWPAHYATAIQDFLAAESPDAWHTQLQTLRSGLAGALDNRGGYFGLRWRTQDLVRRTKRVFRPTGLFVVVIGPDGAGKSTILQPALAQLARGFRRTHHFHWRPGLLPKPGRAQGSAENKDPSDRTPPKTHQYGIILSLLRYSYFLVDFCLGYWLRLYPLKTRTYLIIGERWYYDVIINPVRYGFRLPGWLLKAGRLIVPEPDLTVLLEAAPEAIHARKPELSVAEIAGQLAQMSDLLDTTTHSARLRTDGPIDSAVHDFVEAVLARQSQTTHTTTK